MQCHIKRHAYQELFSVFHELYFIFREQFVYIHELIYAAIYIIYDTFIVKIFNSIVPDRAQSIEVNSCNSAVNVFASLSQKYKNIWKNQYFWWHLIR